MICTKCGVRNTHDSKFCRNCGLVIPDHVPPPETVERLEKRLEEAFNLFHEASYDEALIAVGEVLAIERDNVNAISLKAMIYEKQGEVGPAIDAYEQVLVLNPDSVADRIKLEELKRPSAVPKEPELVLIEKKSPLMISLVAGLSVLAIGLITVTLLVLLNPGIIGKSAQTSTQPVTIPQGPAVVSNSSSVPPGTVTTATTPQQAPPALPDTNTPVPPAAIGDDAQAPVAPKTGFSPMPPLIVNPDSMPTPASAVQPILPSGNPAQSDNTNAAANTNDKTSKTSDVKAKYEISVTGGNTPKNRYSNSNSGTPQGLSPDAESQAYARIGREYQMSGNHKQAVAAYLRALPNSPDKAKIYQQIGTCYRYLRDNNNAATYLEKAIAAYQQSGNSPEAQQGIQVCKSQLAIVKSGQ